MKTSGIFSLVVVLFFSTTLLVAQPGPGFEKKEGMHKNLHSKGIPNLTDDQSKKIETLRFGFQKEMLTFHNQMAELKAKQKTLVTADKVDMKLVNSNIDAITHLQNQMMKKSAEHQQQIRGLLTDEQRLWFDTKHQKKGKLGKHDKMGNMGTECGRKCQ